MAINPGNPDDGPAEIHEINVTPFIDVMLVLLIIFMVAAPLSTVDVDVDLPASSASAAQPTSEPINVTLKKDLSLEVAARRPIRRHCGASSKPPPGAIAISGFSCAPTAASPMAISWH